MSKPIVVSSSYREDLGDISVVYGQDGGYFPVAYNLDGKVVFYVSYGGEKPPAIPKDLLAHYQEMCRESI
jgi:hypothetical protein